MQSWLIGPALPAFSLANCQAVYTDWQLTYEERLNEGAWVVAYQHYERSRTDSCTGQSVTETKREGPVQLWPAVPPQRVADVSRPQPFEGAVSGTPLRSTDGAGGVQTSAQVGPKEYVAVPVEHLTEPETSLPVFPLGLVLLVGVLAYSATRKSAAALGGATQSPHDPEASSSSPPTPGSKPSTFQEENGTHTAPDLVVDRADGVWTWHWEPQYETVTEKATIEEEVEIRVPEEVQVGYKLVPKTVRQVRTERVKVGTKIEWERVSFGRVKVPVQKTRMVEKEVVVGYNSVTYQDGYDVRTRKPYYRTEKYPIKEKQRVEETYWTEEWQEDFDMIPHPVDVFEERTVEEYVTTKVREPLFETHWITQRVKRPVEKVVASRKLVGWTGEWSYQARVAKEAKIAPAVGQGPLPHLSEINPIWGNDPLALKSSPEASPIAVGDLHAELLAAKRDWWRAWLDRNQAGMNAAHATANLLRARGAREATEPENEEAKLSVLNPALFGLQNQWWDAKIRRDEQVAAKVAAEGQRLRSLGATVPLAETQAMSGRKLHDALVDQKHTWWTKRLTDDQDGMDTAHETANYLRALGAVVTDEETASINAEYEPLWQAKLRQEAKDETFPASEAGPVVDDLERERLRQENGLTPGDDTTSTPPVANPSVEDLDIIAKFYGTLPAIIKNQITPDEAKFMAEYIQGKASGFSAPRQYPEQYARFYVLAHRLQSLPWESGRVQRELALATGKVFSRSQLEAVWNGTSYGSLVAVGTNPEDLFRADSDSAFAIGFLLGSDYVKDNVAAGITGDTFASSVIYGDLRDAVIQGYKLAVGDDFDELILTLALVGLLMEVGWLDGPILDMADVGNGALATIKASLKRAPKMIRDLFAQALRAATRNIATLIGELKVLADAARWVAANSDLAKQIVQAGGGIAELKWLMNNQDRVRMIVDQGGSARHLLSVSRGGQYTSTFLHSMSRFVDIVGGYLDGMPVGEFKEMATKVADRLSPDQVELVKRIRNLMARVDTSTLLQKVIPPDQIDNYLSGAWDPLVGGFLTRAQDVQDLSKPSEIVEGLALLYKRADGSVPFSDVKSVGVIRFRTDQAQQLKPAFGTTIGGNIPDPPPFTGTGFTGSSSHLIPEFHTPERVSLQDGAELWEVFEDGTQVLRGIFSAKHERFIRIGG